MLLINHLNNEVNVQIFHLKINHDFLENVQPLAAFITRFTSFSVTIVKISCCCYSTHHTKDLDHQEI